MEKYLTSEKLPIEEKLVIVYLENKVTVGKLFNGYWAILHEIDEVEPISFGEVVPEFWSELPN